jgi:hypothetical protein
MEDNTLTISYPQIETDSRSQDLLKDYNEYLDTLNVYTECEELFLETDSLNELPSNLSKFEKLSRVNISGGRFWSLKVDVLPQSVTYLDLSDHSNLNSNFYQDIDKHLPNLKKLLLPAETFGFEFFEISTFFAQPPFQYPKANGVLPFLPSLSSIVLSCGYPHQNTSMFTREYILSHPFLLNYKDRVQSVIVLHEIDTTKYIVTFFNKT